MLRLAVVSFLILLAACGREEAAGDAAGATATQATGAPGPDGFVGRWAAQPNLCTTGAWSFAPDGLTTAGEVSCRFGKVERTSSGWEIAAACTGEAPAEDATLTLTLTDPAPPETMSVYGGPFESVTLRRCP